MNQEEPPRSGSGLGCLVVLALLAGSSALAFGYVLVVAPRFGLGDGMDLPLAAGLAVGLPVLVGIVVTISGSGPRTTWTRRSVVVVVTALGLQVLLLFGLVQGLERAPSLAGAADVWWQQGVPPWPTQRLPGAGEGPTPLLPASADGGVQVAAGDGDGRDIYLWTDAAGEQHMTATPPPAGAKLVSHQRKRAEEASMSSPVVPVAPVVAPVVTPGPVVGSASSPIKRFLDGLVEGRMVPELTGVTGSGEALSVGALPGKIVHVRLVGKDCKDCGPGMYKERALGLPAEVTAFVLVDVGPSERASDVARAFAAANQVAPKWVLVPNAPWPAGVGQSALVSEKGHYVRR